MSKLKQRLLVVEDDALAQQMVVMKLEALGFEIHTADTGSEAIAQFKQHEYDLIFMDLGLPDIDGYTVTETIRRLEESKQAYTPIVALTAHSSDQLRKEALQSGMDDFLTKPLMTDEAKTIIEKYVNKKSVGHSSA